MNPYLAQHSVDDFSFPVQVIHIFSFPRAELVVLSANKAPANPRSRQTTFAFRKSQSESPQTFLQLPLWNTSTGPWNGSLFGLANRTPKISEENKPNRSTSRKSVYRSICSGLEKMTETYHFNCIINTIFFLLRFIVAFPLSSWRHLTSSDQLFSQHHQFFLQCSCRFETDIDIPLTYW